MAPSRRLLGFAAVGLFSLVLGFALSNDLRIELLTGSGFVFLTVTFFLFCGLAWQSCRTWIVSSPGSRSELKRLALASLIAIGVIGAFEAQSPPKFRVLADEVHLLGTSLSLYHNHRPTNPIKALYTRFGHFVPKFEQVDKRGLTFPYLLYLTHSVRGYDPDNAFYLNALLGVFSLVAFYLLVRLWFEPSAALAGMLLLGSFPLLGFSVTSAGFEVANLTFLLLTVWLTLAAVRRSDWALLFVGALAAVLAAQLRYESVLLALPAVAWALLLLLRRQPEGFGRRWLLLPLLFLPFAWHQAASYSHEVKLITATSYFSLENLLGNGNRALLYFFGHSPASGSSPLVALLGLLALPILVFKAMHARDRDERGLLMVCAAGFIGILIAIFSYWSGDLLFPATTRLGVVILPALALAALGFLVWTGRALGVHSAAPLLIAAALLSYNLPALGRNLWLYQLAPSAAYHNTLDLLEERYQGQRICIATPWSGWFVVQGYNSLEISDFTSNEVKMRKALTDGEFAALVLIEILKKKPTSSALPIFSGDFVPVQEIELGEDMMVRVSEMTPVSQPEANSSAAPPPGPGDSALSTPETPRQ